ncbi:MAG TPA: pirin family protein [Polyangia bacterium]|nr:pirin family protein [Polyangia bacterium]
MTGSAAPSDPVGLVLEPRECSLGDGFFVRRVLPAGERHAVGPFLFLDHFGPTALPPGVGMDVRPHPHINLATVTYLYEGEIDHRDSLGSLQTIRAGDINWMTAGRGIVHSERTPASARARGATIHGLQLWVGLPRAHEETAPAFHHHAGETLPVVRERGVAIRVLAGDAFGGRSPVQTLSRLVYLDVKLEAGASLELPAALGDRGVYVVDGDVSCAGRAFSAACMLVLVPDVPARLASERGARFVVVGGEPFPEPRHLWWNFASSSQARLEQAKRDWLLRRGQPDGPFPLVPGDESDFIPLPEPG